MGLAFMAALRLWPGWQGECDVIKIMGPEDFARRRAAETPTATPRSRPGRPGWPALRQYARPTGRA